MAEQKNEVQVTFGDKLVDQLTVVSKALPQDFNQTRFVQNALSVLNGNKDLQRCTKTSLLEGLLKGAFLGLDFCMKECYLIPYGTEATFQTDYKGEIKFVKKYSEQPIKDIYAKVVRQGDSFVEKIVDGHPSIDFEPLPFNGNDIIGVFAVCLFADGTMIYETMSVDEVQKVRKSYSKASQSKAWVSSFDQMCKKVCLRRLTKMIPTSFESVEAHNAWEDASGMDFSNSGSAIDHSAISQPFGKKEEQEQDEDIIDGVATEIPDVPIFA